MLHSERKPCLVAVLRSRAHSAKPLPYPSAGRRTEGAKYSSVFSRCLCRPQPVRRKFASQRDAGARMRAVHALVGQFALEQCRGPATDRTTGNEAHRPHACNPPHACTPDQATTSLVQLAAVPWSCQQHGLEHGQENSSGAVLVIPTAKQCSRCESLCKLTLGRRSEKNDSLKNQK